MAPAEFPIEILRAAGARGGVLLAAWFKWRTRAWPAAVAVDAGYVTNQALALGAPEAMPAYVTHLVFRPGLASALPGAVGIDRGGRTPVQRLRPVRNLGRPVVARRETPGSGATAPVRRIAGSGALAPAAGRCDPCLARGGRNLPTVKSSTPIASTPR